MAHATLKVHAILEVVHQDQALSYLSFDPDIKAQLGTLPLCYIELFRGKHKEHSS